MVEKVVLVNLAAEYGGADIDSAHNNLGILTIKEALNSKGFDNVILYPDRKLDWIQRSSADVVKNSYLIANDLKALVGNSRDVVFGFSVLTRTYDRFRTLATIVKQEFPDSLRIAGGLHFSNEVLTAKDGVIKSSIELALKEGLVHGVVQGHAQPFIDLITDSIDAKVGLYTIENGKVIGNGVGKFPILNRLPYYITNYNVQTIINPNCNNACDYCSVNKQFMRIDENIIISTLIEAFSSLDKPVGVLKLDDPNPLSSGNKMEKYRHIIKEVEKATGKFIVVAIYLDLRNIAQDFEKYMDYFEKNRCVSYFIGRDCVSESVAKLVGRNYKGNPRTQQQLDEEYSAILRLINDLQIRKFQKTEMTVSYIFSPFETRESALKILQETEYLNSLSSDKIEVFAKIGIADPYPGTQLRRRCIDHIKYPEDFEFFATSNNVWKPDAGPAAHFLQYFDYLSFRNCYNKDYFNLIGKLVMENIK